MRELDVEADQVSGLIEEREGQRVGQVADAQHLARVDGLERRQGRDGCRRRRARHGRVDRFVQQMHRRQHLVLRVLLGQSGRKEHARAAEDHDHERRGDACVRQERSAPPAKVAGDGAGDEERHRERVHRRHERSHARVDDAGREKQLKRIGWNPEQVEQKRHGGGEAAEEGHEPGECQLRIARRAAPARRRTIPRRG